MIIGIFKVYKLSSRLLSQGMNLNQYIPLSYLQLVRQTLSHLKIHKNRKKQLLMNPLDTKHNKVEFSYFFFFFFGFIFFNEVGVSAICSAIRVLDSLKLSPALSPSQSLSPASLSSPSLPLISPTSSFMVMVDDFKRSVRFLG